MIRTLLLALVLAGCGATQCQQLAIDVYNHPTKRPPAGKVVLQCNGKTIVEVVADNVEAK